MTNTGNEKVVNTTATINIKQVIRGYMSNFMPINLKFQMKWKNSQEKTNQN